MEKALKMGKMSAIGSFQLFIGQISSTVLLAVGTIILGSIIDPVDYGLYVIAIIPSATILLFQDWGIGSALVRYCASYRSQNKEDETSGLIFTGLIFEVTTGLALTVLSVLIASFIASTIFNKPESTFLMLIASMTIFSTSLIKTASSIFVGFERMNLNVLTTVIQAVTQSAVAPLLVFLGYGSFGAMAGYTLASVVAAALSMMLLYFGIIRKIKSIKVKRPDILPTLKMLLGYGIPLSIATLLGGLLTQFYSFMMATFVVDASTIANYKIATNFAVLLTILTFPISTVLFPAFSKLNPRNERALLKTIYASSIKYTVLLLLPATMVLVVLAAPLIGTIYGSKWPLAPLFLSISVTVNILSIFGSWSVWDLLSAFGETKTLLKLFALTLAVGVPLGIFAIPVFGIIGLIIVNISAGLPSFFIAVYLAWKHYGVRADFSSSARIFISSIISAATCFLFIILFNGFEWVRLLVGAIIFLFVFLISAPLIGAVNQADVYTLRTMFSGLGVVSKFLEIPLKFVETFSRNRAVSVEVAAEE